MFHPLRFLEGSSDITCSTITLKASVSTFPHMLRASQFGSNKLEMSSPWNHPYFLGAVFHSSKGQLPLILCLCKNRVPSEADSKIHFHFHKSPGPLHLLRGVDSGNVHVTVSITCQLLNLWQDWLNLLVMTGLYQEVLYSLHKHHFCMMTSALGYPESLLPSKVLFTCLCDA